MDSTDQHAGAAGDPSWRPALSLWDATSLMIGIVVGTSLFASPRMVFSHVSSPTTGILAWLAGGILSTIGALLFAELAVSVPRGGSYAYLTAAFGRAAGMVYGVALVSVMLTANIGAMAFAFARYTRTILSDTGLSDNAVLASGPWLAAGAVLILAVFNSFGFTVGRLTQNLLTGSKLLGLALIVVAGFCASVTHRDAGAAAAAGGNSTVDYPLAMVIVLYAFGGWSDAAAVAAEVRNRSRNIPLALVGGLAAVTAIYVAVNAAYVSGIGFTAIQKSDLPAFDVVNAAGWGSRAAQGVSLLVMISALGAVQGMLFSGSRAVAAMGRDHASLRPLGIWNERNYVPTRAVWMLASISLIQIGLVGTGRGRAIVDGILAWFRSGPIAWEKFGDGFDVLVYGSAPTFWALMIGVGAAF
ncbi:MAG TPA: amino acid permease, partial [Caulifigura sp.]|nr:amino acid permease [Caulifigura sp.]